MLNKLGRSVMDVIVVVIVFCLALLGVMHAGQDYRHFSRIEKSCRTLGYVQDDVTRITCSVDPKPKAKNAE